MAAGTVLEPPPMYRVRPYFEIKKVRLPNCMYHMKPLHKLTGMKTGPDEVWSYGGERRERKHMFTVFLTVKCIQHVYVHEELCCVTACSLSSLLPSFPSPLLPFSSSLLRFFSSFPSSLLPFSPSLLPSLLSFPPSLLPIFPPSLLSFPPFLLPIFPLSSLYPDRRVSTELPRAAPGVGVGSDQSATAASHNTREYPRC